MEEIATLLLKWGLVGLIIAAFTESFISPVLPDVILIPLALANTENAIWYGLIATLVSVAGGVVGYFIGARIGVKAARKLVPRKYLVPVRRYVTRNAAWAVFLAALSPVPYKFVSITAGALKISWPIFLVASFFGRAKRFMIEGVLIYYFGPKAIEMFNNGADIYLYAVIGLTISAVAFYAVRKFRHKKNSVATVHNGNQI